MLSGDLRKLLIAQIGNEFARPWAVHGISLYFDRQSLSGWGKLFRDQAIEEAQHAQKIMDFLTDNEVDFDLPALKAVSTRFAFAAGRRRAGPQVGAGCGGPVRPDGRGRRHAGDHRGHQFLQWFIEEQVEEEAKLQSIVDLIDSGINLFQAEALLDGSSSVTN